MALFGQAAAPAASSTTGDTSKDVEVPAGQVPSDSISDLQFSPTNDFLAVGSWDKKVYIYEVNGNGAQGKWMFECPGHVLGLGWSKVRLLMPCKCGNRMLIRRRMALVSQPATPQACSTLSTSAPPLPAVPSLRNKPKPTRMASSASAGSRLEARTTSLLVLGTRPSSSGTSKALSRSVH
jgi:hypothetical protein